MSEAGSLLQGVFALGVVLLLLWGAAKLARRAGGVRTLAGASPVRTITSVALGARERVVVLEAGEQWLLVGVSPGNMRTLHVMPKGELAQPATPQFQDWLSKALRK